jgi:phenylalanine-4-hydroxylase
MKSQSGISYSNAAVAACPKHLLQFAVDQRYDDYTPVDHAVWRFIMRQNIFFLKEYAHKVYFQGLLNTGISFERIPRIEEMNDILYGISSLQGAGDRLRHAADPSHRIYACAGHRA